MEKRTIRVKGTGIASVPPDFIEVSMNITTLDEKFNFAMNLATDIFEDLKREVQKIGFSPKDIKTSDFSVDIKNERYQKNDVWKDKFIGFEVTNRIHIGFDMDTKKLSKLLGAISICISNPELEIRFTVKDKQALHDAILADAANNAKRKAKMLCESLNVKLGQLLNIDYSWNEISLYSDCNYKTYGSIEFCEANGPELNPDDINASDNATFIWEISDY